jgi:hypothetical protein
MFKKYVTVICVVHVVLMIFFTLIFLTIVCICPRLRLCFRAGLRQEHNNPKAQAWGDVQKVRHHDSCCCIALDHFVPLPLWSPWRSHPLCPLVSMDEVILSPAISASAPPRASVAASESMYEVIHSASGPHAKRLEYLSFSDGNTCLFCSIVADNQQLINSSFFWFFKCFQLAYLLSRFRLHVTACAGSVQK